MAGNKTEGGNAAFHNFNNDFAHIDDPHERRRLALEKIDNASFGWYHIRAIMVAGIGFMTDSFDIFAINIATSMFAYVFWGASVGGNATIPASTATLIKVSTSVGTVIGQLFFGWLADAVGRKKIYGSELMIIIAATIGQTIIGESPAITFVGTLVFWRIIMGIGIGGDYPLSSIITSEFATTKWRGAIMGAVFANQGWGQLLGGIVSLVCVAAWKNTLIVAEDVSQCVGPCITAIDQMWRILIGIGAVPAVSALYFRLTIPETPRYSLNVNNDESAESNEKNQSGEIQQVTDNDSTPSTKEEEEYQVPKASFKDFWSHFGKWKHGKILLGTAGSWFLLDVAYYGLSLNNSVILGAIGYAGQSNVYHNLFNICVGNIILTCAGAIPGYWFSVATIDTLGRKTIQLGGFIILTAIFCIIGFAYNKLGNHGLLALYVLAQFFCNFGPNVTTFIYPGEIFPTRYRSTAHGMSAASGKIGAIIAQCVLGPLINHGCPAHHKNCWLNHVMQIFALFMLLGIFTTLLLPETKRKTLEELAETYHGEIDIGKLRYEQAQAKKAAVEGIAPEDV
jgi:PHS family inorganic phosphate transporter-like MFS transporter